METKAGNRPFTIARLGKADAADYRALRLEGLRQHPEAFGASWEEEESQAVAQFAERLARNIVFGARLNGNTMLQGVAGFYVQEPSKARHKGVLWGMYVRPEVRGMGIGSALVTQVIEYAATVVEEVRLTVGADNAAAIQLYARAGFQQYAVERRALKVDGRYYDEAVMALVCGRPR